MFDSVTDAVEGAVSQLGLTFFLAGFVPMLIAVAINQYVYFPPGWDLFPQIVDPALGMFTGTLLTTLALAFALAVVFVPLNLYVIKLFEGLLPGMPTLLAPLRAARRRQHERRLYPAVAALRASRRELLTRYETTGEYDPEADDAIQQELQALHARQERAEPAQSLPYDAERLAPTAFGNAWAVMEEYPLARYGMDGMFYWPYMRAILFRENPGLLGQIDSQKLLIDMTAHMAFVTLLLGAEGAVVAAVQARPTLLAVAALSLLLFALFYASSVQYVRAMARAVTQSFDLYRWRLLDQFGLARPDDLDDEYWVWMRLNAFLRRGEPFYFDMLERKGEDEESWPDPEDTTP